jgi:hypothetical protein
LATQDIIAKEARFEIRAVEISIEAGPEHELKAKCVKARIILLRVFVRGCVQCLGKGENEGKEEWSECGSHNLKKDGNLFAQGKLKDRAIVKKRMLDSHSQEALHNVPICMACTQPG